MSPSIMTRRLDFLLPNWLENSDAYAQSSNVNLEVIGEYSFYNSFVAAILILFFSLMRKYYDPMLFAPKKTELPILPTNNLYSWMLELYRIDEKTILKHAGYDALFYIRFYKLALNILVDFSIYAFIVIMPINRTGGFSHKDIHLNSFDVWTMSNIAQTSDRLWAHVIGLIVLSFITSYYLEKEFSVYALHRHNYLKKRDAHRRTVLVESIPRKLRSNVALATFFEILYPNAIERVRVCQDVRHLDKLVEQQQSVLASLERSLTRAALGKKHPLTFVGLALESTESIEYYQEELDASNRLIALEQKYASRLAYASDIRGRDEACRIVEHYLDVHDPQVMTKLMNERGVSPKEWVKMMEYPEDDDVEGEKKDNERSVRQSVRKPSDAELEQLPFFDWWREIWHSKSWSDAVEVFVSGRSVEYSFKADESTRLIAPPTAAPEQENLRFLSKAFITFKTFTAATTARQVLHIQLPGRLAIQEAPQGSDIIWSNMYTTRRSKMFRSFVVDILIIWMIVLWIVPITLASLILSASALRSKHHHLNELCQESSFLASLIQFIQPITLVLLMELWPITLAELARISGIVSYSKCQKVVFTRYFTFQVINVFLVSTIAGSVLNSLYLVIQNPSVTFTQLGSSLPKMAGFFMSYTLFKALIGLGLEISRLLAFLGVLLKRLITPHMSPRDQDAGYGIMRNMNNPGWFPHAKFYAQDMLIVLVMMTFSCIAPLCLIAGIIYFAGAAYVYKHQMLYVYEPIFESGGTYWPALARRFVFSLFMSQMTMIGMLILKESYDPIYVLVLLMFCTFLYSRRVEALYGRFAEDLPFDQATALDLEMRDIPVQLVGIEEFIQPSLRAPVDVKPILDSSVIKDTNA